MAAVTLFLRHGKEPNLLELDSYTFRTVVFLDGSRLEDVTFAQLADVVWSLQSKTAESTVTLQTQN